MPGTCSARREASLMHAMAAICWPRSVTRAVHLARTCSAPEGPDGPTQEKLLPVKVPRPSLVGLDAPRFTAHEGRLLRLLADVGLGDGVGLGLSMHLKSHHAGDPRVRR